MIPSLWLGLIGGSLVLVGGVYAGWTARDWKCKSDTLAVYQAGIEKGKKDQEQVHASATQYQRDEATATITERERIERINTIYRDLPPIPGSCAADPRIVQLLTEAVDGVNARARGEPGSSVRPDPTTTGADGR